MNRHRWLHENDPEALFAHAYSRVSQRKLRLAMAACLRRAIELDNELLAARHLFAVGLIDRFADGQTSAILVGAERAAMADEVPMRAALRAALTVPLRPDDVTGFCADLRASLLPEVRVSGNAPQQHEALAQAVWAGMRPEIDGWMCGYLRDVFGDPFDPVELSPAWRTPDVRAMARGIYDERDWGRMPVLADALLDAGCDDERVLSHCRQRLHARGCWLLDGLLAH